MSRARRWRCLWRIGGSGSVCREPWVDGYAQAGGGALIREGAGRALPGPPIARFTGPASEHLALLGAARDCCRLRSTASGGGNGALRRVVRAATEAQSECDAPRFSVSWRVYRGCRHRFRICLRKGCSLRGVRISYQRSRHFRWRNWCWRRQCITPAGLPADRVSVELSLRVQFASVAR